MMRFFRTEQSGLYDNIRLQLDAAWGHVAPVTCITPADSAPRDTAGRIVLAVNDAFCNYPEVTAILPGLLASGAVEEIAQATYMEAVSRIP